MPKLPDAGDLAEAAQFYAGNKSRLDKLIAGYKKMVPFPKEYAPTGIDSYQPHLWKASHWMWFLNREKVS